MDEIEVRKRIAEAAIKNAERHERKDPFHGYRPPEPKRKTRAEELLDEADALDRQADRPCMFMGENPAISLRREASEKRLLALLMVKNAPDPERREP